MKGKRCSNVLEMLNFAFGEFAWVKQEFMTVISTSKMSVKTMNMALVLNGPSKSTTGNNEAKIKKVFWFVKYLSERLLMMLAYRLTYCMHFFMYWARNMWQQNVFKSFKKKLRVEVTLELLNKINNDSKLPEGVITNNETYVYECNLQINAQSSQLTQFESTLFRFSKPEQIVVLRA